MGIYANNYLEVNDLKNSSTIKVIDLKQNLGSKFQFDILNTSRALNILEPINNV